MQGSTAAGQCGRHRAFVLAALTTSAVAVTALAGRVIFQSPLVPDDALITGSVAPASGQPFWLVPTAILPLALAAWVLRTGRLRTAALIAAGGSAAVLATAAAFDLAPVIPSVGVAGVLAGFIAASLVPHRSTIVEPSVRDDEFTSEHSADGTTLEVSAEVDGFLGCEPGTLTDSGLFNRIQVQDRVTFRHVLDQGCDRQAETLVRLMSDGHGLKTFNMVARPSEKGVKCTFRDISTTTGEIIDLQRTCAEAEERLQAKSRFVAAASHELRTPLNAIIGFADLFRSLDRPNAALPHDRRQEYVGLIQGAGEHLLEIVNELLDMSRIEAGRYELDVQDVELARCIQTCTALLSGTASDANVRLDDVTDRSLPRIEADARAVRQIVINLISNAVKFAPEGSRVTIGASRVGGSVAIRVGDRGPGISPEDIARLGEPFTQVGHRAGFDRATEGTGLGLSIVHGLVELHGGTIEVRSIEAPRAGHGTDVIITLPLVHEPRSENPRVVRLPSREPAEGPQHRSTEYGRVSA